MTLPGITNTHFETLMRVLALATLLLYLAPGAFGQKLATKTRTWLHRAAVATLAVGVVIALAAAFGWFFS